jgi:hypothetical protein
MSGTTIRRTFTILASAALTAGLLTTALAAPASAAKKPRCAGKVATIVGTARGEVIRGTRKADVIVAKGGHDRIFGRGGNDIICAGGGHDRVVGAGGNDLVIGGPGRDKLYGGPGRDRLYGGPANDRLAGGPGNDVCLQAAGTGLRLSCERPIPPALVLTTGILAWAYGDVDDRPGYSLDDTPIAVLADTNGDGIPSADDTIQMGWYPKTLGKPPTRWARWGVLTHVVTGVKPTDATKVTVYTAAGTHTWSKMPGGHESYHEENDFSYSVLQDGLGTAQDSLKILSGSPSQPNLAVKEHTPGPNATDDRFIDVEIFG